MFQFIISLNSIYRKKAVNTDCLLIKNFGTSKINYCTVQNNNIQSLKVDQILTFSNPTDAHTSIFSDVARLQNVDINVDINQDLQNFTLSAFQARELKIIYCFIYVKSTKNINNTLSLFIKTFNVNIEQSTVEISGSASQSCGVSHILLNKAVISKSTIQTTLQATQDVSSLFNVVNSNINVDQTLKMIQSDIITDLQSSSGNVAVMSNIFIKQNKIILLLNSSLTGKLSGDIQSGFVSIFTNTGNDAQFELQNSTYCFNGNINKKSCDLSNKCKLVEDTLSGDNCKYCLTQSSTQYVVHSWVSDAAQEHVFNVDIDLAHILILKAPTMQYQLFKQQSFFHQITMEVNCGDQFGASGSLFVQTRNQLKLDCVSVHIKQINILSTQQLCVFSEFIVQNATIQKSQVSFEENKINSVLIVVSKQLATNGKIEIDDLLINGEKLELQQKSSLGCHQLLQNASYNVKNLRVMLDSIQATDSNMLVGYCEASLISYNNIEIAINQDIISQEFSIFSYRAKNNAIIITNCFVTVKQVNFSNALFGYQENEVVDIDNFELQATLLVPQTLDQGFIQTAFNTSIKFLNSDFKITLTVVSNLSILSNIGFVTQCPKLQIINSKADFQLLSNTKLENAGFISDSTEETIIRQFQFTINMTKTSYAGLIGNALQKVTIEKTVVLNANLQDGDFQSALIGFADKAQIFINEVNVTKLTINGGNSVGGLIGANMKGVNSTITNIRVLSSAIIANVNCGGLVGYNLGYLQISVAVLSNSTIMAHEGAGGVIGQLLECESEQKDVIVTSNVQTTVKNAGGYIGVVLKGCNFTLNDVKATTDVSSPSNIGIAVGYIDAKCHLDFKGVTLAGNLKSAGSTTGGIAGYTEDATIKLNDVDITISSTGDFGSFFGTSSATITGSNAKSNQGIFKRKCIYNKAGGSMSIGGWECIFG